MPYKLTEAEKEAIRNQYRTNIETINSYINRDEYKFKLDMDGLNKKLNDPAFVYHYKKSLETNAMTAKQKEIQTRLDEELKHLKDPNKSELYTMSRFMHNELIPSDDPAAEAYNREKIRQYYLHPEAVAQRRFQRFLNSNVADLAKIAKSKDRDNKMVAWASKNHVAANEAYELFGTLSKYPKDMLTPEMEEFLSSIGRNYEVMNDTTEKMVKVKEDDLVLPEKMVNNQEYLLDATDFAVDHPELSQKLSGKNSIAPDPEIKAKGFNVFFDTLEKAHIDLSKDGILTEYYVENAGGNEPKVSLGKWANTKLDGKPTLKRLTPEQVAGFKKIFKVDYTKEEGYKEPDFPESLKEPSWKAARDELVFKYAVKYDLPIHEVDNGGFSKIAECIKGGMGERLFRTTSHQYNNLIQTLKDFDNENHVNYKNSTPVKMAANDYLIHKGVKTREEAMNLPYPAKDRALLCFDVIDEFQKAEPASLDKMVPGTRDIIKGPHKEWPPAIEDPNALNDELPFPEEYDEGPDMVKQNVKEDVKENDNEIKENVIENK